MNIIQPQQSSNTLLKVLLAIFVIISLVLATASIFLLAESFEDEVEVAVEDVVEEDNIKFPELEINGKTISLLPTNYIVRVREAGESLDDVVGQIYNSALPYTDLFDDPIWFYKTTVENIVGIRHQPETFTANEYLLVKEDNGSSVKMSTSFLADKMNVDFGFLSPDIVPEMNYTVTTNLNDQNCNEVPEEIIFEPAVDGEPSAIYTWLDDCNDRYPVFVSALIVDGSPAFSFDATQAYRVQGFFDDQVSYKTDLPVTSEVTLSFNVLGASPDLDVVYFRFRTDEYSINMEGEIERVDAPDELVNITNDHY